MVTWGASTATQRRVTVPPTLNTLGSPDPPRSPVTCSIYQCHFIQSATGTIDSSHGRKPVVKTPRAFSTLFIFMEPQRGD